jgi:Mrp family chromosome partitioning ATPase
MTPSANRENGRIVQFVESRKGEGCSPLLRTFAQVSARRLKKTVLLLDSDSAAPSDFDFFDPKSRLEWLDVFRKTKDVKKMFRPNEKNALFVAQFSMKSGALPVDFDSQQTDLFLQKLKAAFDLILVDSWSISDPPKPAFFSSQVDGLVLVVEAGKTRWQVAEKLKKEITAQGGKVLGIILNNRTYPIPDSIYRRL